MACGGVHHGVARHFGHVHCGYAAHIGQRAQACAEHVAVDDGILIKDVHGGVACHGCRVAAAIHIAADKCFVRGLQHVDVAEVDHRVGVGDGSCDALAAAIYVALDAVAGPEVLDVHDGRSLQVFGAIGCFVAAAIHIGQNQGTGGVFCIQHVHGDGAVDLAALVVAAEGVHDGAAVDAEFDVAGDGAVDVVAAKDVFDELATVDVHGAVAVHVGLLAAAEHVAQHSLAAAGAAIDGKFGVVARGQVATAVQFADHFHGTSEFVIDGEVRLASDVAAGVGAAIDLGDETALDSGDGVAYHIGLGAVYGAVSAAEHLVDSTAVHHYRSRL